MGTTNAAEVFVKEVSGYAGNAAVGVRIQHSDSEINLVLEYEETHQLTALSDSEPGSVQIGTVAGVAAFWSNDNGRIAILVGTDHEFWDFGLWMNEPDLLEIIEQVEQLSRADL